MYSDDEGSLLTIIEIALEHANHGANVERLNLYHKKIQHKEKVCDQYIECTKHVRYPMVILPEHRENIDVRY